MCGIGGFVGDFDGSLLRKMRERLAHRGPDDEGEWHEPKAGIGLVHRRLSIIDLSSLGHQPMWDVGQKVAIVFNGEIYNYRELREELVKDGYRFQSQSDTEVLLNLYLKHGEAMLPLLNGIFAFALWNTRKASLFLARDGAGVKPLYYAQTPKGFLFASELKAILQEPSVGSSLDPTALQDYLTYLWCPAPRTLLKEVRKLEPGFAMSVTRQGIQRKWQHYDLPYHEPSLPISSSDAILQMQAHLKKAVERQMVADVPVGTFLSGGLDSSAVSAMARERAGKEFHCFTMGFKDKASVQEDVYEDLPYARKMARHLNAQLHVVTVGAEMSSQLEKMIYHVEEPQGDPAALNIFLMSQLAKEKGITVLLSGIGGDDVFAGYRRHHALMSEKYWTGLPKFVRTALSRTAGLGNASFPLMRRLRRLFQYADCDSKERLISYFYWLDPKQTRALLNEDLRRQLKDRLVSQPLLETLSRLPDSTEPLNQMLYLEGKHFLADHNLNYIDKMAMACGVEVRIPFLDPDLLTFAARLPVSLKHQGAEGKWILKKAMEPYLPREIIYRSKTSFGVPLRTWIRGAWRPLVHDLLTDSTFRSRGWFDVEAVRNMVEMNNSGRIDAAYTIFSVLCVELWCRLFLDRRFST